MVRQLAKGILEFFERISNVEHSERSHQVELIGKYDVDGREKDVICTVQLKHYIPRDVYGEGGHFYDRHRQRLVRNKDRKWVTIDETKTYYEMSEADKKFVYVSYVYHHLTQRQIAKLSGIPQPYVFRYIKHNKLKPKYPKTVKSQRNVALNPENFEPNQDLNLLKNYMGLTDTTEVMTEFKESNVEMDEGMDFDLDVNKIEESLSETDIDFEQPFHLDPFPCRSEWKVRRAELGLKNGENWRNTPYDENPGPKVYGDGSTVRRRKVAKLARREKRRIKNIQKFNLHQNNRYQMTEENPTGIFTKEYVEKVTAKKRPKHFTLTETDKMLDNGNVSRVCSECGKTFIITEKSLDYFTSNNLMVPKRCKECRQKRKNNNTK